MRPFLIILLFLPLNAVAILDTRLCSAEPRACNSRGDMVGTSSAEAPPHLRSAVVQFFDEEEPRVLFQGRNDEFGMLEALALAINDDRWVVGYFLAGRNGVGAAIWDPAGTLVELPEFHFGGDFLAFDISNDGWACMSGMGLRVDWNVHSGATRENWTSECFETQTVSEPALLWLLPIAFSAMLMRRLYSRCSRVNSCMST